MGKATSLLGWYTFQEGNYLLRFVHDLTPTQAATYEKAFREILQRREASPVPQTSVAQGQSPKPLQVTESGWSMTEGYVYYVVVRNPSDAFGAGYANVDIEMTGADGSVRGVQKEMVV